MLQGLLRQGQKWTIQRRIIRAARDGAQRSNRRVLQRKPWDANATNTPWKNKLGPDQEDSSASRQWQLCFVLLGIIQGHTSCCKRTPGELEQLRLGSRIEAETRVARELIYEARILNKLGDHSGLPLLFGVCTERTLFRLTMQSHCTFEKN